MLSTRETVITQLAVAAVAAADMPDWDWESLATDTLNAAGDPCPEGPAKAIAAWEARLSDTITTLRSEFIANRVDELVTTWSITAAAVEKLDLPGLRDLVDATTVRVVGDAVPSVERRQSAGTATTKPAPPPPTAGQLALDDNDVPDGFRSVFADVNEPVDLVLGYIGQVHKIAPNPGHPAMIKTAQTVALRRPGGDWEAAGGSDGMYIPWDPAHKDTYQQMWEMARVAADMPAPHLVKAGANPVLVVLHRWRPPAAEVAAKFDGKKNLLVGLDLPSDEDLAAVNQLLAGDAGERF